MDTGLLNLEEHFSTYYVYEETDGDDPSSSDDINRSYFNEWEDERELNGDIGLIPESSSFCGTLKDMTDMTDSPPSLLFQKMIDWSTFIYVDGVDSFPHEPISHPMMEQEEVEQKSQLASLATNELGSNFADKELSSFDLTTYINESAKTSKRKVKSTGKKIDKQAQKYIIEDKGDALDTSDEIDVETVFEGTSLPVLEATDAFSLLEQFEASEKPILPNVKHSDNLNSAESYDFSNTLANDIDMTVNKISTSPLDMFDKIPNTPIDIFEDVKVFENVLPSIKVEPVAPDTETQDHSSASETEKVVASVVNVKVEPVVKGKIGASVVSITEPTVVNVKIDKAKVKEVKLPKVVTPESSTASQNYVKNKQILEALPQELIARINESGKRKTITVIPPIPTKKRGASRSVDNASQHRNKLPKVITNEQIQFDHDYCAAVSPYPKEPQKDSGFQSSEEDDRAVIRNQPTVKTADGKLMVSLLKVNTIRNNVCMKKKLNLEEYKKRRFINSNATSQSNSPASSTCSSPLPEDENLKRLKHQEKLMKMAADLLNTPAKSTKQGEMTVVVKGPAVKTPPPVKVAVVPQKIAPPPDLEVKTYVSIGTNTDISSINCTKSILASAQQLEEIKPLLKKVSDKINSNSFITSLIENIPKVKTTTGSYVKSENQEVVREDKIIHYLKKDRLPVKTNSVGSQTYFDVVDVDEDVQSRYRRRMDGHRSPSPSSGSSSHSSHRRRRNSSSSSRSSRSSASSSSRSSRSRSRSMSPKRQRQYSAERLREVEERRVVYVGRITKGTTKEDLRRRFMSFGTITNVSLHFREYGDNYGFVTFANKEDAYEAVEHGNDGHAYPKYDLSFGGRRIFCKTSYSDLDNMREDDYNYFSSRAPENSFDALLRAAQEKLRKRKP